MAESEFDAVQRVLQDFPELAEIEGIFDILTRLVIEDTPSSSIVAQIRQTPEWKERFAGIDQRKASGLAPINEAEYLELERTYRQQLSESGLLGTLGLNNTSSFRQFAAERIGADVSAAEFSRRVDKGVAIAKDSGPLVQQAFQDFYGTTISDDALLLWALDPDRGLVEIERQIAAATVGAEAFRFGLNVTRTRAELLSREGVTADLARRGFADVARETPQLERLASIHNTKNLSDEELQDFFFHEDPDVGKRRAETFQKALAQFQQNASPNVTREGGLAPLVDRNRSV